QADDLRARFKVPEWGVFCHTERLRDHPARLNLVLSDSAVGAHRTSMLQDLDQGRPMEIDALIGSVKELGLITQTPTPTIDTVLALTALRGKVAGLYAS
ncbi:hypothetical protein OAV66_04720, partial [Planktomarina temperata]|nr:hypothetical protein [Planktomarina temperata]